MSVASGVLGLPLNLKRIQRLPTRIDVGPVFDEKFSTIVAHFMHISRAQRGLLEFCYPTKPLIGVSTGHSAESELYSVRFPRGTLRYNP